MSFLVPYSPQAYALMRIVVVFLFISAHGPGIWSVDGARDG